MVSSWLSSYLDSTILHPVHAPDLHFCTCSILEVFFLWSVTSISPLESAPIRQASFCAGLWHDACSLSVPDARTLSCSITGFWLAHKGIVDDKAKKVGSSERSVCFVQER